jgi:hypothetical protein
VPVACGRLCLCLCLCLCLWSMSLVPVFYVYFICACHLIGNATPLQRGDYLTLISFFMVYINYIKFL